MKTDVREYRLPASFFALNRQKLLDRLPERALAVIFAGRAVVMSTDDLYPFFANRNFFYLTGIEQEESVLVMLKTGRNVKTILFLQVQDPLRERWTGKRMTREEATEISGIPDVLFLPALEDYLSPYISDDELPVALEECVPFGPGKLFERTVLSLHKEREILSVGAILAKLRMVKEPCEIEMIRLAIELTDLALTETAAHIRPGVSELELTTAFDYALDRRGCRLPAFESIFAAGKNALCLHHMNPVGQAGPDELIQVDVGGRVAGLCADISRVYPASGYFTERQKLLYEAVRACQETAFRVIGPGKRLTAVNEEVKKTARAELERIGVIPGETPADSDVSSYYWHSVSHHMGMDVHDLSIRELPLEPGMVITVEPGLYVERWGFGFRIEDDVVVTEDGCEVLSAGIPREYQEIEETVGKGGRD